MAAGGGLEVNQVLKQPGLFALAYTLELNFAESYPPNMNKYRLLLCVSALLTLLALACEGNRGGEPAPVSIEPVSLQVSPVELGTGPAGAGSGPFGVESSSVSTAPDMPTGSVLSASAPEAAIAVGKPGSREPASQPPPAAIASNMPETGSTSNVGSKAPEATPVHTVATESPAVIPSAAASQGLGDETPSTATKPTGEVSSPASAIDTERLFAQMFSSPSLQMCLSRKLGMPTLMQFSRRQPTLGESTLVLACLDTEYMTTTPAQTSYGGLSVDPKTLLTRALESPGLMWCIAGNVGMETLVQITDRSPTAQETLILQRCLDDRQESAAWDAEWPKRIDAAFTPRDCVVNVRTDYPASYYNGPLIDTHLHLPQLPDDSLGGLDDSYQAPRGSGSDLYDTIAEADRPLMGRTVNVNGVACTLKNEGTIKAFTFFPTFPEITTPAIDVAYRTVEENPSLFVPFIQASASGVATLEGDLLDVMLGVRPDFFFGFGEVGDSPTESINPKPDSEIYTGDFEVARDHGIPVYFHVGEGDQENMARALQRFPEVTFIVHGDFVRPHINDLMNRYPNIYFTFNDIFDEHIPLFRFGDKEVFMSAMERDWDRLLDNAVEMYKPMIEAHPDRYMWGTDRGDIVWNYDEDLGRLLADYGRAFIGRFDPAIQEKLAYKNAERLLEGSRYQN